jgi:ABC-2 type transport system permease protein
MLKKALAFLKKDFLIHSSYGWAFLFNIFSVVISLLGYYFIDKMFGHRITEQLQEFGVGYFSYVLLSTAFFGYIGVGMGSFAESLRFEQTEGTLEAILLTPTSIRTILFSMALWNFAIATVDMLIYAVLGTFLFNIDFSSINALSTSAILLLTIVSFSALGILSASFIMVLKKGNLMGWLINSIEGLVGGAYFPVTVLPLWLQVLAKFLPITYAIRAIELAVYRGYSLLQLWSECLFLFLFSVALLPLSICAFKRALKKSMRDGSLAQY